MPGRNYTSSSSSYRYGFNGKENDNEVKGEGNQQDYGMRIYDARLGKFLSVDPLRDKYPWYTPYQFAGNKPIIAVDLDGGEEKTVIRHLGRYDDGSFYIKSTDVNIDHNARFFEYSDDGKVVQKAVTNVYAEYQGQTTQIGYRSETVVDGGMKPSACYDYTKNVMLEKFNDDQSYHGWNPAKWLKVIVRDIKSPDNAQTVSNIQDLGNTLLTQLAAFSLIKRSIRSTPTVPPITVSKLGGRMLIVDENLSPQVLTTLRNRGYNAITLPKGTLDADILTIAEKNNAIVVTNNVKDFRGFVTTFAVSERMKATNNS